MADNPDIAGLIPDDDLTEVDSGLLTRLVKSATREQLDALLAEADTRRRVLAEVFRRMDSHVRPERVGDMHAVVRWRITGGSGPGGYDRYETTLADGTCTVSEVSPLSSSSPSTREETSENPRVTITLSAADFLRLIAQQQTPAELFVTGMLQVKGDLGFAAGLIGYFDLPRE